MKKYMIVLAVIFTFVFLNVSFAENHETEIIKFGGINLSGDTVYLVDSQEFSPAIGYQLATLYKGMFEIRAEYVPIQVMKNTEEDDKFGIGIGFNVRKLMELAGGTWKITLNPTLGVLILADTNNIETFQIAPYVNIINVGF